MEGNLRLWNERDWNVVKGENFINRRCSFEAEYARKTGMKKRGRNSRRNFRFLTAQDVLTTETGTAPLFNVLHSIVVNVA